MKDNILNKLGAHTEWVKEKLSQNHRNTYTALGLAILVLISTTIALTVHSSNQNNYYRSTLHNRQIKLQKLIKEEGVLKAQKATSEQQVKDRDQKIQDNQKQIDDLNAQLQAKKASQSLVAKAVNTITNTQTTYAAPAIPTGVTNCGTDPNMAYIYQHESGCRTNAIGPNGPCGLGQALPCSKMPCSLSDWDCQNNFFVGYAISRYGSTAAAYAYWIAHSYW